jgi:hypothetical protein
MARRVSYCHRHRNINYRLKPSTCTICFRIKEPCTFQMTVSMFPKLPVTWNSNVIVVKRGVNRPVTSWLCLRRISLGSLLRCQAAPLGSAYCCRWFSDSACAARYGPNRQLLVTVLCVENSQIKSGLRIEEKWIFPVTRVFDTAIPRPPLWLAVFNEIKTYRKLGVWRIAALLALVKAEFNCLLHYWR